MIDIGSLIEEHRAGGRVGLPCFCTANAHVLRSILKDAAETGYPTVIEATCNQVNQDGGYTGMQPEDFMAWVRDLARQAGVPMDQLVLGGDHLGPNPWRKEDPVVAMDKARELVKLYAVAGFRKIHLDASMPCGGEPSLSFEQVAERAADLCAVAEAHAPDPSALVYVIGTEVPTPGGESDELDRLEVSSVERLGETINTHRYAFDARGLNEAWSRIVAVVTQPGVDFSHTSVHAFDPEAAAPLRDAIAGEPGLVFEAHSTDYQTSEALRALVESHFFFLKVGPELTFRFREAVLGLAAIDDLASAHPSRLSEVLLERMDARPEYWVDYYRGSEREIALLKRFSYSDRIRYYWADPDVARAVRRLIDNLKETPPAPTVVSQFFQGLEFGRVPTDPEVLIHQRIGDTTARYFAACGHGR